jgi:hypothetical protein
LKNQGTTANAVALEQAIPANTDYLKKSMTVVGSAGIGATKEYIISGVPSDDSLASNVTDATVSRIRFSFTEMKNGSSTPKYVTLNYTVVVK